MKKRTVVGVGASIVLGVAGAITAAFFSGEKAEERRNAVLRKGGDVIRRERAQVMTLFGSGEHEEGTVKGADAKLREAAVYALREVFGSKVATLNVSARKGIVTIKGEVEHLLDIEEAEAIVRSVDHVKDVNNLLRLAEHRSHPESGGKRTHSSHSTNGQKESASGHSEH